MSPTACVVLLYESTEELAMELCILMTLTLLLAILGFAIYGVVVFAGRAERLKAAQEYAAAARMSGFDGQIRSTCTTLNTLFRNQRLTAEEYGRFRDVLEAEYGHVSDLPPRIVPSENAVAPAADQSDSLRVPFAMVPASERQQRMRPAKPVPQEGTDVPTDNLVLSESVEAELVSAQPRPEQVQRPPVKAAASAAAVSQPAPWDMPDAPERPPRRPLGEVLAGFMQERNIRWGELASGILIVGSAVGLVVSLREQLRDTIPYFPALLFMLLTGAIHAAGLYTLKRWKLRDTSRGVLIIGLLLVPLNFLSACILTGGDAQRAVTDPVYWLAMVLGVGAFTTMTWSASKSLLRRGYLPLALSILSCSILVLFYNRLAIPWDSRWLMLLVTTPAVGGFLIGVLRSVPGQWGQRRLSERATNRLFLLLGLSAFSFAAVAALLFVRAPNKLFCLLDLLPALSVIALTTAGVGLCVSDRRPATASVNFPLVGKALAILGFGSAGVILLLSVANAGTLLMTSGLCVVGLLLLVVNRRLPQLLPAAWFCLGVMALTALNLQLGVFHVGDSIVYESAVQSLVSANAGLCLMVVAVFVVSGDYVLRRFLVDEKTQGVYRRNSYLSAGGALVLGGALALAASFLHPDDPYSVHTASLLLVTVAICCVGASAQGVHVSLPYVSAGLLVAAWWHALLWNVSVGKLVLSWSGGIETRYAWVGLCSALPLAIGAMLYRLRRNRVAGDEILQGFCITTGVVLVVCVGSGGWLVRVPNGNASLTLLGALGIAALLGVAARMTISRVLLACVSLSAVMVVVADASLCWGWCDSLWSSQQAWLQLISLAGWCLAATAATAYGRRWLWGEWLIEDSIRIDIGVRYVLAALFALMIGASMTLLTSAEVSSRFATHPDTVLQLRACLPYALVAGALVVLALLWESLFRSHVALVVSLVAVWFSATTLFALPYEESRAVGSALRWLMPFSGVVLAGIWVTRHSWQGLVPRLRAALGLPQTNSLTRDDWQQVINVSLAVPVIVTLLIASLITGQYLLYGAEALGGPTAGSLLGDMKKDVSFGVPLAILISTCLLYAVSEKRSWLAVVGSGVLQYVVGLSLVLLVVSPHPQLATDRFLNILQAVSLGMTIYGMIWLRFAQRIGPARVTRHTPLSHLDLHGIVNVVLVSSLGVLILNRVFWYPEASLGWVNAAGGSLGFAAFGLLLVWGYAAWPEAISRGGAWSVGLAGVVASAFLASQVDQRVSATSWWPYRSILLVCVVAVAVQFALVALRRDLWRSGKVAWDRLFNALPMLCVGVLATLFVVRGATGDGAGFWYYLGSMVALVGIAILYGFTCNSPWAVWVAAGGSWVSGTLLVYRDPFQWPVSRGFTLIHVWMIGFAVLAMVWLGFYFWRRRRHREQLDRSFVWFPNLVALGSSAWFLFAAVVDGFDFLRFGGPLGWALLFATGGLLLLQVANERSRAVIVCRYLWFASIAILVANFGTRLVRFKSPELAFLASVRSGWLEPLSVGLMLSVMTAAWAQWYRCRAMVRLVSKRLRLPRRAAVQRALAWQTPFLHVLTMGLVLLLVVPAIFWVPERSLRYVCGLTLFPLAFGFGGFAATRRAWVQWCSLAVLTLAGVMLAWADLPPHFPAAYWVARMLIVLCASIFVYGIIMPRWLDASSLWLTTVRGATGVTCVLAAVALGLLLGVEFLQLDSANVGVLPVPTALAVAVMCLAAMGGLLAIAVLPQHDPLALEIEGRMLYVYAAQVVGAAVVAHLYMSMPWLFRFGLAKYWPYFVMGIAFGGVSLANLLKKRELTVLAKPFFHTAAIMPVVASVVFWPITSQAEPSIVMLMAGGVYLLIGTTRSSLVSSAIAVVFANVALWLFYDRFDVLAFASHPQLWLIPPALSVLVAAQWQREQLTKQQLAACRYLCVVVIYISSTAEIYISGIGTALWPPMVLALFSVMGILLGIALQVRAYLYLGATFLFLAMVTMVSHATQRLDHVWPWWAFGILLGIAILVFFGVFEKKKNEMRALATRFQDWDY